jgi:pyruvate,water dikinase
MTPSTGYGCRDVRPSGNAAAGAPAFASAMMPPPLEPEAWDPLHSPSAPGLHWSTVNASEAVPGVQTPLSWTMWTDASEASTRRAAFAIGAMTKAEREVPRDVCQRYVRVFCGRIAIQCEVLGLLGDRMPGTSGPATVSSVLGYVPPDMEFHPTRRWYPVMAYKLPTAFVMIPRQVPRFAAEYERWRRAQLTALPNMDRAQLSRVLAEARDRVTDAVGLQTTVLFAVVQPLFDALSRTVEAAGVGDVSVLSGTGGAEMAVISDIWAASRGRLTLEQVVANHGFHGPVEGELSSRVWREDPAPLRKLVDQYAARGDDAGPANETLAADERRREQTAAVLAALPRSSRPGAKLVLKLAGERILLRGVAKRSFLGAFDVGRAGARRLGEMLAACGRLAEPEDVFFLTVDELAGRLPRDVRDLVTRRRERHAEYRQFRLPSAWTGAPVPIPIEQHEGNDDRGPTLQGIGVSAGVIEGTVRVVLDPAFADVEPDEILVAPVTDPSWSSIMFISSGLIVDVGGPLSHAALVARELGIPCVVNTGNGTGRLRTGDRVRLDGSAGSVDILDID